MNGAFLGLISIVIFAGGTITGEEVNNGTILVTTVLSDVSKTADSDKSEKDDMLTSASTNIVHWMSTLSAGRSGDDFTSVSIDDLPANISVVTGVAAPAPQAASSTSTTVGNVTDHPHGQHIAEEVSDMNIDPYRNHTDTGVTGPDEGVNKDTVTVQDTRVVANNKTHEQEAGGSSNLHTHGSGESQGTKTGDRTSESVVKPADAAVKASPGSVEVQDARQSDTDGVGSGASEVAAILGGVLVGVAVAGYLGLLAWRRLMERRYGNREILINEDDDLQHFEL